MAPQKRKRASEESGEDSDSTFSIVQADDEDIDISSALVAKHTRNTTVDGSDNGDDRSDDDEFGEFINDSIARRNVKGGTDMLKKIKRKGKGKGEVGGGSFQSMGTSILRMLYRL